MAKKRENRTKEKNKKNPSTTPKKSEINEDIDTFNDSCVVKYEVLPPRKNNFYERKFIIHSISGKSYVVTINRLVDCTCPICVYKARRCKHIDFVMNEILHEKYPKFFMMIKLWIIYLDIYPAMLVLPTTKMKSRKNKI